MRILIVDDEKLTRDGLVAGINWHSLSFEYIDQADDGVNALQIAKKYPPDILLTDVRMPRMNGIELVEKIQELNPNCSVIFMSGYSDKEYLKAAIKLRAVRYVEKPIDTEEIMEALMQSVNALQQNLAHQKTKVMAAKEATAKYALSLTRPGFTLKNSSNNPKDSSFRIHKSAIFTTIILKMNSSINDDNFISSLEPFGEYTKKQQMKEIHFIKNDSILVMHLYGNEHPEESALFKTAVYMKSLLPKDGEYFIVIGKTVTGPEKVFESYNSAVILMQSTFFFEYGSILMHKATSKAGPVLNPNEFLRDMLEAIKNKDMTGSRTLADSFYSSLKGNRILLANNIKDLYYKIFMQINATLYDLKLQTENSLSDSESLLERISECETMKELQALLLAKIDAFDEKIHLHPIENSTVFLIRDYISKHYGDYTLSIKDISDHVHLSFSYLCTVYKTETGETLNQYITDYRIEKAKQLLEDSRNKVTEVSARVGYSDCNYFGKIFKKTVGVTPSEYREKILR